MITVYDLGPSNFPESLGCSPLTRRVIFSLNYKKLPFKVSIVSFETLEPTAKSIGAPPTSTRTDGSPKYTVPFIHDSATGKSVSDGILIADYLDEAYPDTPKLFPEGTRTLQAVFCNRVTTSFYAVTPALVRTHEKWMSAELRAGRAKTYGPDSAKLLSSEEEKKVWANGRKTFDELDAAYGSPERVFVMGINPVFADLCLAAMMSTIKVIYGDESEEWKDVSGWVGGRAGRVVE
ncbi:hypothetical protein L218DRAFT_829021, partial [Marasmius fiardii PR-910]